MSGEKKPEMTLLALIPARSGSKGIYRKNIKEFLGKPLINWTIESALSSPSIDRVVVSTDDIEIASIAREAGAEIPFMRPLELSGDRTPGIYPVIHALEELPEITEVINLQPTSPLRTWQDIEAMVDLFIQSGKKSVVSLSPCSKHPAWMFNLGNQNKLEPLFNSEFFTCRQDFPETFLLNGAMYIATRDFILSEKSFINKDTIGYVMPIEKSIDIDTNLDWDMAEYLQKIKNSR